ncbi:MAG: aminotransferase class IV [Bacteroidota bacterium]
MHYYNINGEIIHKEKAHIHISDLALHRGYSIFDYFCVRNGKPLFIEDYLDRFERSAAKMLLELPISRAELKERIAELLEKNKVDRCGVKLILTGGYAPDGYTPAEEANLYILVLPPIHFPQELIENGMKLLLHEYVRYIPSVKTTNYVEILRNRERIKAAGANDLLFHFNGLISESSRSNFFLLTPDNKLVTSSDDVLYGITRKQILGLAKAHYELEIRPVRLEELRTAKEAFICSSAKGAIGIVEVDDCQIGDGRVGEVTKHLGELYEAHANRYSS